MNPPKPAIYTDHACPTCKHLPKEIPVPGTRIYLDATAFDPHIKHDGIVVRNQSNGALLGKVASAAGSGIGMKTWLRMLRKDKVVVMGKVVGEVRESRDESGSKEVTFKVECVRMGPSLKGFVQKIDA